MQLNISSVAQDTVVQSNKLKEKDEGVKNYNLKYQDIDMLQLLPRMDAVCKLSLLVVEKLLYKKSDMIRNKNVGVYVQTNCGLGNSQKKYIKYMTEHGEGNKVLFQHTANNLIPGLIAIKYGIHGYHTTMITNKQEDCSALILAGLHIGQNEVDSAIVVNVMEEEDSLTTSAFLVDSNKTEQCVCMSFDEWDQYQENDDNNKLCISLNDLCAILLQNHKINMKVFLKNSFIGGIKCE